MSGWMIALIVVAAVIVFIAVAFLIGALAAVNAILGKRVYKPKPGETAEKYGVDTTWFDSLEKSDKLEITSFDGIALRAFHACHADGTKRVAILQHGYRAGYTSMMPYAKIFFDNGYDVIMPSARAHGMSDGKYIGMAWLDRFDIMRWVDKAVELYGGDVEIALLGVSMGGSTVIAAAGTALPTNVKCVIDDCGFNSQHDIYRACLKSVHLPASFALLPLSVGVRLKCGYSIAEADISELAKNMTVPALFFHGKNDGFVPFELGRKLYEACGSAEKNFVETDAEHAMSYAVDKEKYTQILSDFVDKHIKPNV